MRQTLLVLFFVFLGTVHVLAAGRYVQDSTYKQHLNLVYGPADGIRNQLDLFLPLKHSADTRLIVFVHGGSWKYGNKKDLPKMLINLLTAKGYGVVSLNYRLLKDGQNRFPTQIEDLKNVFAYLTTHAAKYGYKGDSYALMGASAGAHLSLLYTYTHDKGKQIKTIIDIVGPTDLTDGVFRQRSSGGDIVTEYLNNADPNAPIAIEASPIRQLTRANGVPTIIFHGEADELVPVEQAKTLHRKHQELGIRSQLELYPGETHEMKKSLFSVFTKIMIWLQDVYPAG